MGRVSLLFITLFFVASFANAKDFQISIIRDASYHAGEAEDVIDGETWIAIVESDGKSIAKHVKISAKTEYDGLLDAKDGPFTGKVIESVPNTVFLLKGFGLREGADVQSIPLDSELSQNLTKPYELKGAKGNVRLDDIGGLKLNTGEYEFDDAHQFVLKLDGKDIPLTEVQVFNDALPYLIWAGDLNNDGYPDFVANISYHYNISKMALFMSYTYDGSLDYKKVAERQATGC